MTEHLLQQDLITSTKNAYAKPVPTADHLKWIFSSFTLPRRIKNSLNPTRTISHSSRTCRLWTQCKDKQWDSRLLLNCSKTRTIEIQISWQASHSFTDNQRWEFRPMQRLLREQISHLFSLSLPLSSSLITISTKMALSIILEHLVSVDHGKTLIKSRRSCASPARLALKAISRP